MERPPHTRLQNNQEHRMGKGRRPRNVSQKHRTVHHGCPRNSEKVAGHRCRTGGDQKRDELSASIVQDCSAAISVADNRTNSSSH